MSTTYGNLNIATAWEAISDEIGDLTAISSSENSKSWEEFEKHAASLAKTFSENFHWNKVVKNYLKLIS